MDTIKNDLYTRKLAEKWNFIRKFAAENTYRNMIYCISKRMEIAAAHQLRISHESKCSRLHGHNWTVTVYLMSEELNEDGMVADFTSVKESIHGYLDHGYLNDLIDRNPTAENIAQWIVERIPQCYKAVVQESEGNTAMAVDERKIAGKESLVL